MFYPFKSKSIETDALLLSLDFVLNLTSFVWRLDYILFFFSHCILERNKTALFFFCLVIWKE